MDQCAQFSKDPRKKYGKAVKRIGRYFKGTERMGIYICPRESDVKIWADDDFISNWYPEEAKDDSYTARSHLGSVVSYFRCPVMWKSQIQTEISLIST